MGWEDNGSDKGNNGGKLPQTGGASPTFFVLLVCIALVATDLLLMRGEKYRLST